MPNYPNATHNKMFFAHTHLPSSSIPHSLISKSKTQNHANQIHAHFITTGILNSTSLSSQIILSLLSSPHRPLHILAHRLFFHHKIQFHNDPFMYNAFIKSFCHGPNPYVAIYAFSLMLYNNVFPDKFSFTLALKACCKACCFKEGAQIHALALKSRLTTNLYLQNCLIVFYSKCGSSEIARQVFDRIVEKDCVSWNSMIDGYVKNGELGVAGELFNGMRYVDKNTVTWNTMIGGYASTGIDGIDYARVLFDRMPNRDLVSWNLMLHGYAKCRRIDDLVELFDRMPKKDVISWANLIAGYMEIGTVDSALKAFGEMHMKDVIIYNIMMNGYVKNGKYFEALNMFRKMQRHANVKPDVTTLATALSAVSELGRIRDGILIHEYIYRNTLSLNDKLGVGLIDMYSKCGRLEEAINVFEISSGKSVDHWNAMIYGLAINGYGDLALKLFLEMGKRGLCPDDITFVGILNACSHSGLVKEGMMCFDIMRNKYKLKPKIQHYGCLVDILGRGGRIQEAWKLIQDMPLEPNDVIWKSLLSSCRKHGKFEMAIEIANAYLTNGKCGSSSSYILLSNIYAGIGMWREAKKARITMKERGLMKVPGCSWIELDGIMHEFVVGDYSHRKLVYMYDR